MADSGELGCGSLSISPAELRAALALEDGRQPPLGSDRAAPLGGQGAGAGSCGGAALLDQSAVDSVLKPSLASAGHSQLQEDVGDKRKRTDMKDQQRALEAFLGKGNSVSERMALTGAGTEGIDMQSAIFDRFQLGEKRTVPWFRTDGLRYIKRHDLNHGKIKEYEASIKTHGILQGVRGEPWLVFDPTQDMYLAITFGTLSDAFYEVCKDPAARDSAVVQATKVQGLVGARILDHTTPEEVLVYLRDLHNNFHGGLAVSFHDCITGVGEVEQAWKSYCMFKGLTHRNCKIQKELFSYIKDNWSHRFKTGQLFDLSKRLAHDLADLQILEEWDTFFGLLSAHPEGESTLTVIENMQSCTSAVCSNFANSYPAKLVGVVLLEALKFMVHLVETDEYRTLPPPAAFAKHNPSLFEILKTPIAGAAWVNKLFKKRKGATSAAGDVLPEADAGVQPDAKRKSKAKGKAKAKAKSKAGLAGDDNIEDKDLVVQDMKMELADCRPKWWLDDLIGCLLHAAKCGPDKLLAEENTRKAFSACVSYGLEFCFYKMVSIGGKVYKTWSQVRPQLQQMMHLVHSALPAGKADTMVQSLLAQIRDTSAQKAASEQGSASSLPRNLPMIAVQSAQACGVAETWLRANSSTNISAHPAFSRFVTKLRSELCTCGGGPSVRRSCVTHGSESSALTMQDIFFEIGNCMFETVPEMVPTVALGVSMLQNIIDKSAEDAPEMPASCRFLTKKEEFLTPENFKDVRVVVNRDALDVMLNARPLYMAEGLKAVLAALQSTGDLLGLRRLGIDAATLTERVQILKATLHAASKQLPGLSADSDFLAATIEGKLCLQGADSVAWGSTWAKAVGMVSKTSGGFRLPAVCDLFPDGKTDASDATRPIEVKDEEEQTEEQKDRTGNRSRQTCDNPMLQSQIDNGLMDVKAERVAVSAVYSFAEVPGCDGFNVMDILFLQRVVEQDVLKTAMSYKATLEKIFLDYSKGQVMCASSGPRALTEDDRIYVFGSMSLDQSAKCVKVGTIKEAGEDKPELFSFFCGPTGYDKVSSPAPCAAWIMKAVVDDTDSEDDFNASFKAAKTPLCFKHDTHSLTATSTISPDRTFTIQMSIPYLQLRPPARKARKRRKEAPSMPEKSDEKEMTLLSRPSFFTRAESKRMQFDPMPPKSMGGKMVSGLIKPDEKGAAKSNRSSGLVPESLPTNMNSHLLR